VPKKKPTTRSPITSHPVRDPGQSLRELRLDLFEDYLLFPLLMVAAGIVVAIVQWMQYLSNSPPHPWLWTAFLFAALVFFAYRFIKVLPKLKRLRQGAEGERAVGQYLERLREQGYQVFHDIIGDGFNVDHVLIGPAGVFTVETKTWSKPAKGEARIQFDGKSIRVGGREPDRSPLIQASAQAGWLRALLEESTGIRPSVRPVVVFPGWYIDSQNASSSPVWVLNPKALPTYLANAPEVLSPDKVKMMSYNLSRFIRNTERELEVQRRSFWNAMKPKKSKFEI